MLAIANGVTLTISGPIKAPRQQIFIRTPAPAWLSSAIRTIKPGCTRNGPAQASVSLRRRILTTSITPFCCFQPAGERPIDFAGGIYDIDDQIPAGRLWFKGASRRTLIF